MPGFALSVVVLSIVEFTFGFFIQGPLASARSHVDEKQLIVLYAVWIAVSVVGFMMIANTFVKRWATIYGLSESPRWLRQLGRLLLISPLLSVWALLYTLLFAREGLAFSDGSSRSKVVGFAFVTLLLFHFGYLGVAMVEGDVRFSGGRFSSIREVSQLESVSLVVPGARPDMWLPGAGFSVHVYPYLSPLMKLALMVYGDFVRAKTVSDAVAASSGELCADVPKYEGQSVPNCFLTLYREMGERRAFVTPAFAILFESRYRQAETERAMRGALTPMLSFGFNAISLDNIIGLLEPSSLNYDRRRFTHPIGMLALFGSPELPSIAIGQDMQRFALSSRLLPALEPQLTSLNKSLADMKGALDPSDETRARARVRSLEARITALKSDPLAIHSDRAVSPAPAGP